MTFTPIIGKRHILRDGTITKTIVSSLNVCPNSERYPYMEEGNTTSHHCWATEGQWDDRGSEWSMDIVGVVEINYQKEPDTVANSPSEKYNQFRNFMVNELGITRADIEGWTKESVAVEVNKKLGQLNVEKMVKDSITQSVHNSLGNGYNSSGLREQIAKEIAARFTVTVATKA